MKQFYFLLFLPIFFTCKHKDNNIVSNVTEDIQVAKNDSIKKKTEYQIDGGFKIGEINDSDGYTNLRLKPNSESKIISKILEQEYFFYKSIENSNWSNVKTLTNKNGYVHNSRINTYQKNDLISTSIVNHTGDIESIKDTIINIKSFDNSATFLIDDFNYKSLEKKELNDSLVAFIDGKLEIKIVKGSFELNENEIEFEDGFISLINGEKAWGVENNTPKNLIKDISINGKTFTKNQTQNLFSPNLDSIRVFKKNDISYIIWMLNGDGAGAYSVVYFVEGHNVLKRFIYLPF